MRFTSHRDFSRAFERALIRAGIPMAMSSGFNPHPRLSYAGAAPTGAASEAEFLEIGLKEVLDPEVVLARLAEVMPDGLDLIEVAESPGGSLADLLEASDWFIELAAGAEATAAAVSAFLAAEEVPVERMTKRGLRSFDSRGAVLAMTSQATSTGSGLRLRLRHQEPSVRPDDVIRGLVAVGGLQVGVEHGGVPLLTRLTQGTLSGTEILDPLR